MPGWLVSPSKIKSKLFMLSLKCWKPDSIVSVSITSEPCHLFMSNTISKKVQKDDENYRKIGVIIFFEVNAWCLLACIA